MSTNPSPRLPDFQIEYCYVSNFLLESNSREWELNKVSFFLAIGMEFLLKNQLIK